MVHMISQMYENHFPVHLLQETEPETSSTLAIYSSIIWHERLALYLIFFSLKVKGYNVYSRPDRLSVYIVYLYIHCCIHLTQSLWTM